MKVCFIWVEKFRNFRNFGLNLSSSTKFSFINSVLSVQKLEPLPYAFFGENITEVAGIVGKNGVGKSNALELVCNVLKSGKTALGANFLVILEESGDYVCQYFLPDYPDLITPDFIKTKKFDSKSITPKVVFFSNVFDERRTSLHKDVADISVNNAFRRSVSSRPMLSNFEKQIRLVNSKIFRSLEIELPEKVQLLNRMWSPRIGFGIENIFRMQIGGGIRQFRRDFRDRVRDISVQNKFPILFKFGFFFETLLMLAKHTRESKNHSIDFFTKIPELLNEIEDIRSTEEISDKLISYLSEYFPRNFYDDDGMSKFQGLNRDEYADLFRQQLIFVENIKASAGILELEYFSEGIRTTTLEYFTFNFRAKGAKSFITEYTQLFGRSEIFDIDWLGISSGSRAYLNIFASLHLELKNTRHEELILCIDEGDLYLHPKWQVEFFDKLLTSLPALFQGRIQLILTSHSPFLLSDLPRQNLTILNPEAIGSSMNGIDLITNTFGGNLYDLYSEPFFLGDKRTSDFAYKKIKHVVEEAEAGNLSESRRNELSKHLSLYGDEIIQYRLSRLLRK